MKISFREKIFLTIIFIINTESYSQSLSENYFYPNSPSTSKLEKVNLNNDVSEFKGVLDLTIPIYEIVLDEVKIPIYLSYDSSGIKLDEEASDVGQSWSLMTGGLISRSQISVPDDMKKNLGFVPSVIAVQDPFTGNISYQYCESAQIVDDCGWIYSKNKISNLANAHELGQIFSNTLSQDNINYLSRINNGSSDFAPDIFNLILSGVNGGKFILDDYQSCLFTNKSDLRVNWNIIDPNKGIEMFRAKNGMGTNFVFKDVEYLRFQKDKKRTHKVLGNVGPFTNPIGARGQAFDTFMQAYYNSFCNASISQEAYDLMEGLWPKAWHLSEVETLNKRKILYTYEDEISYRLSTTTVSINNVMNDNLGGSNVFEKIKRPVIKEINWVDGRIEFIYSSSNREDVYSIGNHISQSKSLDKIKIYDCFNKLIKEISFHYSYRLAEGFSNTLPIHEQSLYKRLYLDKVSFHGGNISLKEYEYSFLYNNIQLPFKFSFEKDYWGFYNNNNGVNGLPKLWYYPNEQRDLIDKGKYSLFPRNNYVGNETVFSPFGTDDRRPNPLFSKAGLLEKIIYPTGGEKEIEYEQNEFLYRGNNVFGPGVRVKRTAFRENLSDLNPLITNYKYSFGNNLTSGRIRELPVFIANGYRTRPGGNGYSGLTYSSEPINSLNLNMNEEFGYLKVEKEFLNGENGKEVKEFSYPIELGQDHLVINGFNVFSTATNNMWTSVESSPFTSNTEDYNPFPLETNFGISYGKLLKNTLFDSNGIKVFEKSNTYEFLNPQLLRKALYVLPGEGIASIRYMGFGYELIESNEEKFKNNDSLENTKEFAYNANNQVTLTKQIDSGGNEIKTVYEYADSNLFQFDFDVSDMKNLNMISYPIVETVFKNNFIVSKKYNEYYSNNSNPFGITNPVVLKKTYELEINKPINNFQEFNWYDMNSPSFGTIDSRLKVKNHFSRYDSVGNLLEYSKTNGVKICLIWGYNNSKVIAKIENLDYASISQSVIDNLQLLSNADNDNCSSGTCNEQTLRTALNNLRTLYPQSLITTYTHDPLIGVTSITDERGKTGFYQYDEQSRLQFIRDNEGNILKGYEYHYKGN